MAQRTQSVVRPEAIEAHDSVRVPDGRIGEVVGFYRREVESVLVQFAPGDSGEFLASEVVHTPSARSRIAAVSAGSTSARASNQPDIASAASPCRW
jgi:hypothetical protein